MKRMRLRQRVILLSIVAVALLLRMVYLIEIRKSPFFLAPFGDAEYFHIWAMKILSGDFIGSTVFFKAPLYAYVLALFYRFCGYHLIIPRLVNMFLDATSVFLLFLIARKLFNRTVGFIAAGIFAIGGIFIYFAGEILGTSLSIMLGLAVVNLLLYKGQKFIRALCAGCALSLLILVRPNALLLLPGALLFFASSACQLRKKAVQIVLFLVGVLTPLVLCGIRNYAVGKDFVLINYSGGVNFYIGNNEESDGVSAVLPGYGNDWDEYGIAEQSVGRTLKPSEVSRYWMRKGFHFIGHHPGGAMLLLLKKCYLLFNGKEISNNQNIYRFAGNSHLLKWLLCLCGNRFIYFALPSSLIIACGLWGMILSFLRDRGKHLLLYLFIICYGISVVLFFISARYRMLFIVYLIPFAAFAIHSLWSNFLKRRRVALCSLFLLPLLLLCNIDPYGVSMHNEALEWYNLGNAYFRTGTFEKARSCYENAIAENPYFPRVHLNLGILHSKEQRLGAAEEAFLAEIRINPRDGRAYHNLSLLYSQQGHPYEALRFAQDAIDKFPRFAEAQRNLGRLYVKTGEYDSAAIHLERAYELQMRDLKTLSLLAFVLLKTGECDRATRYYEEALRQQEDDAFLHYNCGVAYIGMGDFKQARKHLMHAVRLQPDFAEAHFNLGMVSVRLNEREKARFHFSEALRLQPGFEEAKKMIEKME